MTEEKKALNARWEEIKKILGNEMIPFLDEKVDQIVKDLRRTETTIDTVRSQSRRCRKSASR